jgi:hypothetical protein
MPWHNERPIFNRLPIVYREPNEGDNPSNWLTDFWDSFYVELKALAESFFERFVHPQTAESEHLDWAGTTLYGYLGEYWNPQWTDRVKRKLLEDAYTYLWVERGSEGVVEYLLELHQIPTYPIAGKIWKLSPLYAGINTIAPCYAAYAPYRIDIRLDTFADRSDPVWVESYRIRDLYCPIWSLPIVGYKYWYAGFSQAGEAVYDLPWEASIAAADRYFANHVFDALSALQWLINSAIAFNSIPVEARVYEFPPFRVGVSEIPFTSAESPYLYILFPSSVRVGDPNWLMAATVASFYANAGTFTIGHEAFWAGIAISDNPLLTAARDSFRRVEIEVVGDVPQFTFIDPDFDYLDKLDEIDIARWLDVRGRIELQALMQWLFDRRGIEAVVVEIPSAAIGITPLPFHTLVPDRPPLLSIQIEYAGSPLSTDEMAWAKRKSRMFDSLGVGYDAFYAGISEVESPLWGTPSLDTRYVTTVEVEADTLTPTVTRAFNNEDYPDRTIYEDISDFWAANPNKSPLGTLQYLLALRLTPVPIVYEVPMYAVGENPIPAIVAEPQQPGLYVIFPAPIVPLAWEESERIGRMVTYRRCAAGLNSFLAGVSAIEHPIFSSDFSGLRRVTLEGVIPTYHEPDVDYPDRDLFESLAVYLEESGLAVAETVPLLAHWLQFLGVSATVIRTASAIAILFEYEGEILSGTENWAKAERVASKISSTSIAIGYSQYVVGVSPLPAVAIAP